MDRIEKIKSCLPVDFNSIITSYDRHFEHIGTEITLRIMKDFAANFPYHTTIVHYMKHYMQMVDPYEDYSFIGVSWPTEKFGDDPLDHYISIHEELVAIGTHYYLNQYDGENEIKVQGCEYFREPYSERDPLDHDYYFDDTAKEGHVKDWATEEWKNPQYNYGSYLKIKGRENEVVYNITAPFDPQDGKYKYFTSKINHDHPTIIHYPIGANIEAINDSRYDITYTLDMTAEPGKLIFKYIKNVDIIAVLKSKKLIPPKDIKLLPLPILNY